MKLHRYGSVFEFCPWISIFKNIVGSYLSCCATIISTLYYQINQVHKSSLNFIASLTRILLGRRGQEFNNMRPENIRKDTTRNKIITWHVWTILKYFELYRTIFLFYLGLGLSDFSEFWSVKRLLKKRSFSISYNFNSIMKISEVFTNSISWISFDKLFSD